MNLLRQLGALKNNHRALETGSSGGSYKRINTTRNDKILAFEREKLGDKIVVLTNLSKDYVQFTMPYDETFIDIKISSEKILSSSYQYDMKPWEFWILIK